MKDPAALAVIRDELLPHLLRFPKRPGEDDKAMVRRWLTTTEAGRRFARYAAEDERMIAVAAAQLDPPPV